MNTMCKALFITLTVSVVGCDAREPGPCLPGEGCDGIVDISEAHSVADAELPLRARVRPDWCEEGEGISYVANDPAACADISILCAPGWDFFDNACGCGCIFAD